MQPCFHGTPRLGTKLMDDDGDLKHQWIRSVALAGLFRSSNHNLGQDQTEVSGPSGLAGAKPRFLHQARKLSDRGFHGCPQNQDHNAKLRGLCGRGLDHIS